MLAIIRKYKELKTCLDKTFTFIEFIRHNLFLKRIDSAKGKLWMIAKDKYLYEN